LVQSILPQILQLQN